MKFKALCCDMNKESDKILLAEFFSTYFHEDFLVGVASVDALIARYVDTMPKKHRLRLSKAIQRYASESKTDTDLEDDLYRDLGCYYVPSGEGISAKSWLKKIAHDLI